jgi:hypothetical protein
MAETMRVNLRDTGPPAEAPQHLLHAVGLERHTRPEGPVWTEGREERTGTTPSTVEVGAQCLLAPLRERGDALLSALGSIDDAQ